VKEAEQLGIDSEVIEHALNLHLDVHACLFAAIVHSIDTNGDGHIDETEVRQANEKDLKPAFEVENAVSSDVDFDNPLNDVMPAHAPPIY
jgi:hypothetical protein